MEGALLDPVFVQQQNRPVPQVRLLALERGKMRGNFRAFALRERPRPGRKAQRQAIDRDNRQSFNHASIAPSVTTTAVPPIATDIS